MKFDRKVVYNGGIIPNSGYDNFTSKYVSIYFVRIFLRLNIRNPNTITVFSFLAIILSVMNILLFEFNIINRIIVAVLIELSFIFDCADGQMARLISKKSLYGAWLDRYLDRVGEMVLYTSIGYKAWIIYGNIFYFIIGLSIGFLFTFYSLLFAIKDSIMFELILDREKLQDIRKESSNNNVKISRNKNTIFEKSILGDSDLRKLLSNIFFFLNISVGERYFFPIVGVLVGKIDYMLIIIFLLFFPRILSKTVTNIIRIKNIY